MKRDVEVPRFLPICRVSTPIRAGSGGIARLYVSERGRALPNIRGGTGHESGRAREPRLVAAFGSIRGAPGGGCSYSFVNPSARSRSHDVPTCRSGPSSWRAFSSPHLGLASGDVGPDVPHDRVYHLEALARHGLYRGLVGHAPVAAALVVLPVVARAARQARAAEYEQVLSCLLPCLEDDTESGEVPDWRFLGTRPQ